jgi:hypothetical protein
MKEGAKASKLIPPESSQWTIGLYDPSEKEQTDENCYINLSEKTSKSEPKDQSDPA